MIDDFGGEATLTITGIKETSFRNEYDTRKFPQVFLIDYTYKNISVDGSMYISDMNFKIVDEKNEVGEMYTIWESISPKEIIAGTTCKAQMAFAVNNHSDKVKLQYWSSIGDTQPVVIIELDV